MTAAPAVSGFSLLLLLQVDVFPTEMKLLEGFIDALQSLDPDIMVGFEVQQSSVGYLADRGNQLEMPLLKLISRMPEVSHPETQKAQIIGSNHSSQPCLPSHWTGYRP